MPLGSCVCGAFTYEMTGKPRSVIICHCIPCRKSSGSNGSYEYSLAPSQLRHLTGQVKLYTRVGDSGKKLDYTLCETCGTMMWCTLEALPEIMILKSGTLDDVEYEESEGRPVKELYVRNRPAWCRPWEGTEQKEGM